MHWFLLVQGVGLLGLVVLVVVVLLGIAVEYMEGISGCYDNQGNPVWQYIALEGDYRSVALDDEYDDAPAASQLDQTGLDFYYFDGVGETINIAFPPDKRGGRIVVTGLHGELSDPTMRFIGELREKGYLQGLWRIDWGQYVSNVGFGVIGNFPLLTYLEIESGDSLTEERVAEVLGKLTQLSSLTMRLEQLTDSAWATTPSLRQLSNVYVSYTALTDHGLLEYLCKIPRLAKLDVSGTRVTAAGLAEAQQLRPDVEIVHDVRGL